MQEMFLGPFPVLTELLFQVAGLCCVTNNIKHILKYLTQVMKKQPATLQLRGA